MYSFLSVQTLSLSSTMVVRMIDQIDFRPVILAGGSGTRFWPRSRRAHAKQVLALDAVTAHGVLGPDAAAPQLLLALHQRTILIFRRLWRPLSSGQFTARRASAGWRLGLVAVGSRRPAAARWCRSPRSTNTTPKATATRRRRDSPSTSVDRHRWHSLVITLSFLFRFLACWLALTRSICSHFRKFQLELFRLIKDILPLVREGGNVCVCELLMRHYGV